MEEEEERGEGKMRIGRKMLGNKLDTFWRRKRISNMKRGQGLSDSRKIKEVH